MKPARWNPKRGDRPRSHGAALLAVVLLAVGVIPGRIAAQEGGEPEPDDQECCLLLMVPVGARASALGGTGTALSGTDAVFRNPSGLAGHASNAFVVHHSDMSLGAQIDAFSLLVSGFSSMFGLSYQLFDKGDIVTTDGSGQPTGELSLRDHLLVASFATGIGGGFSAGVNYKFFQQRIDCTGLCGGEEAHGQTHGVDIGVRYAPEWHPAMELGLSVVNTGLKLQMVNAAQSNPLPARLHLGAAYDVLTLLRDDASLAVRLLLDVRDSLREPGDPVGSMGVEVDVQETIFVRAGYAPGEGLGTGAAVGVELRYDRFDIGVARSFVNSALEADTEPFQVSFGLNF